TISTVEEITAGELVVVAFVYAAAADRRLFAFYPERDPETQTVFEDITDTTNYTISFANQDGFDIGRNGRSSPFGYFDGNIVEVRAYDKALSFEEFQTFAADPADLYIEGEVERSLSGDVSLSGLVASSTIENVVSIGGGASLSPLFPQANVTSGTTLSGSVALGNIEASASLDTHIEVSASIILGNLEALGNTTVEIDAVVQAILASLRAQGTTALEDVRFVLSQLELGKITPLGDVGVRIDLSGSATLGQLISSGLVSRIESSVSGSLELGRLEARSTVSTQELLEAYGEIALRGLNISGDVEAIVTVGSAIDAWGVAALGSISATGHITDQTVTGAHLTLRGLQASAEVDVVVASSSSLTLGAPSLTSLVNKTDNDFSAHLVLPALLANYNQLGGAIEFRSIQVKGAISKEAMVEGHLMLPNIRVASASRMDNNLHL